jgi:hypothetical protein
MRAVKRIGGAGARNAAPPVGPPPGEARPRQSKLKGTHLFMSYDSYCCQKVGRGANLGGANCCTPARPLASMHSVSVRSRPRLRVNR